MGNTLDLHYINNENYLLHLLIYYTFYVHFYICQYILNSSGCIRLCSCLLKEPITINNINNCSKKLFMVTNINKLTVKCYRFMLCGFEYTK